jgi:hypothetical protein
MDETTVGRNDGNASCLLGAFGQYNAESFFEFLSTGICVHFVAAAKLLRPLVTPRSSNAIDESLSISTAAWRLIFLSS